MICNSYKCFFKTLADDCKLNIINLLSKGPLSVGEVSEKLGYEQSRVSHALASLKENGFVVDSRKGKAREYRLEPKIIVPLLKLIDEHVEKYHRTKCNCKGVRWRDMK
ncbi:MAG TPA: metalloregulator ArsR/SmtB family transcription factor [Candidatus Nanoarchaeia archaeon]|nr:metalloregulator ArsR/SmtB family transcription factor [Candidatus Nanoarchaeia archaeon]